MAKLHLEGGVTFEGTPEEIKAYADLYAEGGAEKAQEKPESVPSFKEGDIVVITGNTTMSANEIGDIGVIAELGEDRFVVNVKGRRQGRGWTWTVPEDVRHATQAEREQYEANAKQAEKDAIFTKIGRKPGEFKKGDIVRVSTRADAHKVAGSLVTIAEFREGGNCGGLAWLFEDYEHIITGQYLELIVPVESRVDRPNRGDAS